jgi:hypothetical protein
LDVYDFLLLRKEMVSSNPVATLVSITNGNGTRKHPQAAHVTVATAFMHWLPRLDFKRARRIDLRRDVSR